MKKVLIITYYWPPAGGISVHRSLKFAKYLPQFGIEPVVYTAKNAQYPYYDDSNFKDIPAQITILKHPIIEPFYLFKKVTGRKESDQLNNIIHVRNRKSNILDQIGIWIRGNFFIPDARSLWIKPSVKFLSEFLKHNSVSAIFADGPPHTNTRIATLIAKKMKIPLLADFQDPWTQVDYYQHMKITKWADRIHKKQEQELFQIAKKITIVSPTWKKELEEIGAKNVDVLYWGYDEDDFRDLKQKLDSDFSIVHTGLLGYDRNPTILFKALNELKNEIQSFDKNLKLKFAGQIDYSVIQQIKEQNLQSNIVNLGTIARKNALQLIMNAQLLLLPLNISDNVKGRMPGKFYEYLRAGRPIVNLGPKDSDVAQIVNQLNRGKVFEYDDKKGLKEYIKISYKKFLVNENSNCKSEIETYNVKNQTRKLASFINEISK